jgi:hypothetical protein
MRRSLADLLTGLPNLAHLDLSGRIMTFLIEPSSPFRYNQFYFSGTYVEPLTFYVEPS